MNPLLDPTILFLYSGKMGLLKDVPNPGFPFRTKRFSFRPYNRSDFYAWYLFLKRGGKQYQIPHGILRQLKQGCVVGERSGSDRYWSIEFLNGETIGYLCLEYNYVFKAHEISLNLCREQRGKGLGIKVAEAIKTFVIDVLKVKKLVVVVRPENKSAVAIVRKVLSDHPNYTPELFKYSESQTDSLVWKNY